MAVQYTSNTYPGKGLPGELSREGEPHAIDFVPAQVPTDGRNPRPGDMVYWDTTNDGAAVVTNAAQRLAAFGIVHFDMSKVQEDGTRPAGADTDTFIEYEDADVMPVIVMGTAYVRAGAACEYGNRMQAQDDFKWDPIARAASSDYVAGFACVSRVGADNSLIEVRVTPS